LHAPHRSKVDLKIVHRSSLRFPPETWGRDSVERFQIEPTIQLFHRSVPTLHFLNWTIEEIERGYAVTRLPLNVESSNQYIT
jgi:acyl-coenzyme A thioesterase PaaI-like protein